MFLFLELKSKLKTIQFCKLKKFYKPKSNIVNNVVLLNGAIFNIICHQFPDFQHCFCQWTFECLPLVTFVKVY